MSEESSIQNSSQLQRRSKRQKKEQQELQEEEQHQQQHEHLSDDEIYRPTFRGNNLFSAEEDETIERVVTEYMESLKINREILAEIFATPRNHPLRKEMLPGLFSRLKEATEGWTRDDYSVRKHVQLIYGAPKDVLRDREGRPVDTSVIRVPSDSQLAQVGARRRAFTQEEEALLQLVTDTYLDSIGMSKDQFREILLHPASDPTRIEVTNPLWERISDAFLPYGREMLPLKMKTIRIYTEPYIPSIDNNTGMVYRQGEWSVEELERLDNVTRIYLDETKKTEEELIHLIQFEGRTAFVKTYFDTARAAFPYRKRRSIYDRIKARYTPYEKHHKFSPEEDKIIVELVQEMGTQWSKIGDTLNRRPKDVRDRYRNYLICHDQRKTTAPWTAKELEQLKEAVAQVKDEVVAKQGEASRRKRIATNWGRVSELMGYTRSRLQCNNKYRSLTQNGGLLYEE